MPKYESKTFRKGFEIIKNENFIEKVNSKKIAIFSTCYMNFNEPNICNDFLKILNHNDIYPIIIEGEKCCGMPKLELGDIESVEKLKNNNIKKMVKLVIEGYSIINLVPSCTLMFKQELPLLFPNDKDIEKVKDSMNDPFEYLYKLYEDGLLNTKFSRKLGKVSYHVPCHLRVQNMGLKTKKILQLIIVLYYLI